MKKIIVYHDTETLASRARRPQTGETIGYRAIDDFDETYNSLFDEVIDLSTSQKSLNLPDPKNTSKKGKGHDV